MLIFHKCITLYVLVTYICVCVVSISIVRLSGTCVPVLCKVVTVLDSPVDDCWDMIVVFIQDGFA